MQGQSGGPSKLYVRKVDETEEGILDLLCMSNVILMSPQEGRARSTTQATRLATLPSVPTEYIVLVYLPQVYILRH